MTADREDLPWKGPLVIHELGRTRFELRDADGHFVAGCYSRGVAEALANARPATVGEDQPEMSDEEQPASSHHFQQRAHSEIEPDDRQEQRKRNRSPDRQGGEGGEVGRRPEVLTGGLQRGQRDVCSESSDAAAAVEGWARGSTARPTLPPEDTDGFQ